MLSLHSRWSSHLAPLGKRAMDTVMMMGDDDGDKVQLVFPSWFWIACLVISIVFLPVFLYISYTLNSLMPTLAMVEDPSPPAYEPLSTDPDNAEAGHSAKSGPVTASLRQTESLLRGIGGFRSYFRGISCNICGVIALFASQGFFSAFIPTKWLSSLLAPLPAFIVTLPLTTAWTHIIMSAPKSVPWYRRLPPFRKTITAMWRPALLFWAAVAVSTAVPQGLLTLFGIGDELLSPNPNYGAIGWQSTVTFIVGLLLSLGLVVPAHVIFTRVQASLLPVEDEPIIAFDRSFAGKVEPEVVGGKGYASITDAWNTFSRAHWFRLVKLYAKVLGVTVVSWVLFGAVLIPTFIIAHKQAKVVHGGN